jgi:hypothetical protein
MTATLVNHKAFAVWFNKLEQWQVRTLWLARINRCHWPIVSLSDVAKLRSEVVSREDIELGKIVLLDRISFDEGKVHAGERTKTKMDLYRGRPGDIIVSKINARKRAIGIVPDGTDIAGTIHFRILIPDAEQIVTEFLWAALRSEYCRNQFEMETGGMGKGEISEARLLNIKVPLLPLPAQQAIVRHWQKARNDIDSTKEEIARVVNELNERLYSLYHSICKLDVIGTRFFILNFKDLECWDVKSGRSSAFRIHCRNFRPMGDFIEDATELVRPFDEPEKEWPIYGVNNREGVFFNSYQKGFAFKAPYKRIRKDWFFHNPTRCNVGSLGIVPDVPEDAITSPEYQVWRLKSNSSERLLPGFVALLIQAPFFLELVQFNRVGAVKQRMYYEYLIFPNRSSADIPKHEKKRWRILKRPGGILSR